jgi:hypothetical protein
LRTGLSNSTRRHAERFFDCAISYLLFPAPGTKPIFDHFAIEVIVA